MVGPDGRVIGVDLAHMAPLEGVELLRGDLRDTSLQQRLANLVRATVVISDMSPDLSGNYSVDQARSIELAELALAIASEHRARSFAVKVFEGEDFQQYRAAVQAEFGSVRTLSPEASRKASSEVYLIGKRKRK
jgi:23S rRNA (uridine2552-2'-O)-methyltransferase